MIPIERGYDAGTAGARSVIGISEPDSDVRHWNGGIAKQECFLAEDTGKVSNSRPLSIGLNFALVPREAKGPASVLGNKRGEAGIGS